MNFWHMLAEFFLGFTIPAAVMIIMGLILVIIEMYRSSRRAFGMCGAALVLTGIVIRMLYGGSPAMLFIMTFGVCAVLMVAHMLVLRFQKRGWLYQSLGLSVAAQKSGFQTGEYEFLVGRIGTAVTPIAAEGSMKLSDVTLLVQSEHPIERGERVRVVAVEGEKVYVTTVKSEER